MNIVSRPTFRQIPRVRRTRLRAGIVLAATALSLLALPPAASAATPSVDIASSGPLTHVYLGDELSCQVAHTSDTLLEFYPPGTIPSDCGTFLVTGDELYAPDFPSHGGTATGGLGTSIPFTPVSQSSVTGSGTVGDPYKVTTVAGVGSTGIAIQQVDSYVVGDEAYRTDVTVSNGGVAAASGILYRAGDCFLGGSDFGYGFTETFGDRKAVGCSVNANNSPQDRIEEWVPLTGGNHFYQSFYSSVWSWIGSKAAFPDTCDCPLLQDNGAGISWDFAIPSGGSQTFSHFTTFSPSGKQALVTTKTADSPSSPAGSQNGYTITVSNPNPDAVTLNVISDDLPAGFSYVAGSSTGATTSDPNINGQTLTWSGPISVPAQSSVSLHFLVTVASAAGDYLNQAGGDAADGYTVLPTGLTAPISVTAGQTATATTYTGASSAQYSDPATLSGHLAEQVSGNPIPGKMLDFTLGTQNASAGPTDPSGNASTSLTITQTPGSVASVGTSFAGDASFDPSHDSDPFEITKEDCTLAYTGDTLVNAANMTNLKAQFGEPDTSPGDWSGKLVTFTVTDASNVVQTFTATTDVSGLASVQTPLGPNVYGVGASFAGDGFYLPCQTATDTLVTVQAANAKITGGGWVAQGTGNTNFGFNVIPDVTGLHGQLQIRSKAGKSRFHSTTVLTLSTSGNTGTWTGTGRWNGTDGYTFTISVVDNGSSGKKGDTISIVIKSPTNVTVFTTSGAQPLKGGNITVH